VAGDLTFHRKVRLGDLIAGPMRARLSAGEADRASIAADLDLLGLASLSSDLEVRPWLDGAEVVGAFTAKVTYECGVTLDPFEAEIDGEIFLRLVPAGSPNAPQAVDELELDLEAEDPPDVLAGSEIDLGDIVAEHLALSLDPFPRKPGAEFEPPPVDAPESPFAVLKALKARDQNG
jgi:hypothetical protein